MLVFSSGSKGSPEGPAPLPLLKLVQKKMAGAGPQVSQVIGPPPSDKFLDPLLVLFYILFVLYGTLPKASMKNHSGYSFRYNHAVQGEGEAEAEFILNVKTGVRIPVAVIVLVIVIVVSI